ncbi:hypothetical protein MRB53_036842 [Persea americana]|nr:hypothetical protein MRB53_036842 [Persea americana]
MMKRQCGADTMNVFTEHALRQLWSCQHCQVHLSISKAMRKVICGAYSIKILISLSLRRAFLRIDSMLHSAPCAGRALPVSERMRLRITPLKQSLCLIPHRKQARQLKLLFVDVWFRDLARV